MSSKITRRTFLGSSATAVACLGQTTQNLVLSNESLSVELFADRPVVAGYLHKPSGLRCGGGGTDATLLVNSLPVPWPKWEIRVERPSSDEIHYRLHLGEPEIAVAFTYRLEEYALSLEVAVTADPGNRLDKLDWRDWPMLTCADHDITIWRQEWTERDWQAKQGRGLWSARLIEKPMAGLDPDAAPLPTLYSCFYKPGGVCCAVLANSRYLPLRNQVSGGAGASKSYALSLNTYQCRSRGRLLEPLRATIAFLPDLNRDGRTDASDFQLWVNRQLPAPAPRHRNVIWYKIGCAVQGQPPRTTFAQAAEIIERVHRYTDGLPQVAYLVGWQYDGHDTGYPSLDKINDKLGSRDDLLRLHQAAEERFNTVLSYHINLDDAYKEHPGWDPAIICREPDGSLMRWEVFNGTMSYHISHTKDVESGKVFQRLDAMMRTVPLNSAIHIDAFRNMNVSWEPGGVIDPVDELESGVKPIAQFFKSRGIDVTTESIDADAAEWCGLVSAVWHLADPPEMVQLRHGKMLGGGRGRPGLWNWGLGSGIDRDVSYSMDGADYIASGEWDRLLDDIYLGVLLLDFYVEREMTVLQIDDQAAHLHFAGGVATVVKRDGSSLLVTEGDVVIARNFDRFIPRGESIYAYSRDGSDGRWTLPAPFRNKPLEVRTLGAADVPKITQAAPSGSIDLELKARTPVKITVAPGSPG